MHVHIILFIPNISVTDFLKEQDVNDHLVKPNDKKLRTSTLFTLLERLKLQSVFRLLEQSVPVQFETSWVFYKCSAVFYAQLTIYPSLLFPQKQKVHFNSSRTAFMPAIVNHL